MKLQKMGLLLMAVVHIQGWAVPTFNYEAQLIKPDGTPVTDASTQVKIQIRTPDAGSCLLYEETQIKNLTTSNGYFNFKVNDGSGTRSDSSGLSLEQVFSNLTAITVSPSDCVSGGGTYSPVAQDSRVIKVSFRDSGMGSWEAFPAETLGQIPYSLHALNVNGFPSTALVRVVNGSAPGVTSPLTVQNFNDLLDLVNGSSTKYTASNASGTAIPTFPTNPSTPATGNIWYNTGSNTLNYYNGTTIQTLSAGGAGLANLNGLTGATQSFAVGTSSLTPTWNSSATVHTLNIPLANTAGVSAGLISKAEYDNFNGKMSPALPSGQIFVGNGSNFATPVSVAGDAALSNTGILTIGADFAKLPGRPSGQVFNGGTNFSENLTLDSTSNATKGYVLINPYGGNVAIGDSMPSTALDVAGAITSRAYGSAAGQTGQIILKELAMNGTQSVTLRVPDSLSTNVVLTLPMDDGNPGQLLATDGNGVLAWTTPMPPSTVLLSPGSDTGPSMTFNGDTDTGIFHPLSDNMAITTNATERMRINEFGYVGIGTANPSGHLEVSDSTGLSTVIRITAGTTSPAFAPSLTLQRARVSTITPSALLSGDYIGSIAASGRGTTAYAASAKIEFKTTEAMTDTNRGTSILFSNTPNGSSTTAQRMVINENGSVGIGTAAPVGMLTAYSSSTSTVGIVSKSMSGQFANMQEWQNNAGTVLSSINSAGGMNISLSSSGTSSLPGFSMGNTSTGFWVPAANTLATSTSGTERMRIDNTGNVGIGTAAPTYKLEVGGDINIGTGGTNFRIAGVSVCTSSGCNPVSDARLKKNVTPLADSLHKLMQLEGVEYDWIDQEKFGKQHQIGFIAQDLEKVFPEVVKTDSKSGLKSVAYGNLLAPVIEAIKVMFFKSEDQSRVIASVQAENKRLKQESESIKTYLCAKDPAASFCH